jgi:hypothetical protein
MTLHAAAGTKVGRLRVRTLYEDAEPHAQRCAATLRSLDLEPPGLAPQSILCVRALVDPMPGGVDVRARGNGLRPLAWESSARVALRAALARAVRPIRERVPANTDAVLFADMSELLACAARDAAHGPLSRFWWWQHVLPGDGYDGVVRAWLKAPEYIPAAIDALEASASLAPFLRQLPTATAVSLLDAVLRAHALAPLAHRLAEAMGRSTAASRRVSPGAAARADLAAPGHEREPVFVGAVPPSPWRGVVPRGCAATDVGVERQTFAAMSLTLRRTPSLPRQTAFSDAVVEYVRAVARAAPVTPPRAAGLPCSLVGQAARTTDSRAHTAPATTSQAAMSRPSERRPESARHRETPVPVSSRPDSAASQPAQIPPSRASVVADRVNDETVPPPIVAPQHAHPVAAEPKPDVIESALGGAFFLLNVAANLELYSDGFTARAEIPLGIWDFIRIVAHDAVRTGAREDALWTLLEDLRGPAPITRLPLGERRALIARVRHHAAALLKVRRPLSFLLKRHGRIARSPGHLDVHFSLERHPLEIRIARLDRNPGWIPAAGLHVAFHFD